MPSSPPKPERVRCPKCDRVASRLQHQARAGVREPYTDPAGRAWYRCLLDGPFPTTASGETLGSISAKAVARVRPHADLIVEAVKDWSSDPRKAAPLGRAVEAARQFVREGEAAIIE